MVAAEDRESFDRSFEYEPGCSRRSHFEVAAGGGGAWNSFSELRMVL
jgi:hypothetical protein